MKIWNILLAASVGAALAQPVLAKDEGSKSSDSYSKHHTSSTNSTGDYRLSKLLKASVESKSGESLGKIEDLVFNAEGQIQFAIIGHGGLLGIGEKYVPVPWKAVQVTSEKQFTLNIDKEKLKSAPTTDKNYSNLDQPDYTVTIYRFFEMPVETGAAESPGGAQQGVSHDSSSSGSSHDSTTTK